MTRFLFPLMLALAMASPATSQVLLHADTPVFGDGDKTWPEHFASRESFGCRSLIPFGVWKRTEVLKPGADPEDEPNVSWMKIDNYGVIHCAYVVTTAYSKPKDWGNFEYALIAELGEAEGPDGKLALYALQSGFRPGSSYLLLAARPGEDLIRHFQVLDPVCPRAWWRDAGTMDVWLTGYCAVPSKAALSRMAVAAARRPAAATLDYLEPAPATAP